AADLLAGGHVPEPHTAIEAANDQRPAVRAEHRGGPAKAVRGRDGAGLLLGGYVPQLDVASVVAVGQGLAVRAERHRVDHIKGGEDRDARARGGGQHGMAGGAGGGGTPGGGGARRARGGGGRADEAA